MSPYSLSSMNSYYPNSYSNRYSSPYSSSNYQYGDTYNSPYRSGAYSQYNGGYNPMQPIPGTQLSESTQKAFHIINQLVQAFGGFAHMLESAFHASHSSFMAIIGLAEHLGYLKGHLGRIFSVFAFFAGIQRLLNMKKSGSNSINADDFLRFQSKSSKFKSLLLMGMSLMSPLVAMAIWKWYSKQKLQQATTPETLVPGALPQQLLQTNQPPKPLATDKIEICRAKYDFHASSPMELDFKRGDLIAITSKISNSDGTCTWWTGRLQNGTTGIFPNNHVDIIQLESLSRKTIT